MKNEIIITLVQGAERLRELYRISYATICDMFQFSYSTYRRWRLRVQCGEDPVYKPGPKPLKPLDFAKLNAELQRLRHGKKRSQGVANVQVAMEDSISRRELSELIAHARKECLKEYRGSHSLLYWQEPGAVWSMDIFETKTSKLSERHFVLNTQDLASGYKLPPLANVNEPKGTEVANHLEQLFYQFGPPLFLKRDNGTNLNHCSINDLLARWHVLPLNSPFYCAPYNGAIEHGQGEVKSKLKKDHDDSTSLGDFTLSVALAVHDLNHQPRRKLGGDTSCQRFFKGPRFNYINRKRKEVFLWLSERALAILEEAADKVTPAAAWRIACRTWLVENGLLIIAKPGNVLPHSF